MGVGHDEDEGEGAFEEIDDDALFALDGLDATNTALEGTIDDEDLAGVFEFLEFVGCEDTHVFCVLLDGQEKGCQGLGRDAHVTIMCQIAIFVMIGVRIACMVLNKENLVWAFGHE